jgi:hypothetical protein
MTMTPLEIVKLMNTGVLIADAAGPLLERILGRGTDATMAEVEAAAAAAGQDLDALKLAIEAKKLRDKAEGR